MKEVVHKPVAEAACHVDGQHLWGQCGVQCPGRRRVRVHLSQGVANVNLKIQLTGLCGGKSIRNLATQNRDPQMNIQSCWTAPSCTCFRQHSHSCPIRHQHTGRSTGTGLLHPRMTRICVVMVLTHECSRTSQLYDSLAPCSVVRL